MTDKLPFLYGDGKTPAHGACETQNKSHMAQAVNVFVERVAVDGACSHRRLVVVDGLGRIEQERGNLLVVGHAKTHKGIDAGFGGERVGRRLHNSCFRHE